jgi:hypothetical protein
VMVAMKECWKACQKMSCYRPEVVLTQWLLLQDEENSVNQFEVFRKVVKLWEISVDSTS